jgi:hypothetical protein
VINCLDKRVITPPPLDPCNDADHEGIPVNTQFGSSIAKSPVGVESVHVDGRVNTPDAIGRESEPLNSVLPGELRDNNQSIGMALQKYPVPCAARSLARVARPDDEGPFCQGVRGEGGNDMRVAEMCVDNVEPIIPQPLPKAAAVCVVYE